MTAIRTPAAAAPPAFIPLAAPGHIACRCAWSGDLGKQGEAVGGD